MFIQKSEKKSDIEKSILSRIDMWMDVNVSNSRKILLTASNKEFEQIKSEYNAIVVKDAGLTELDPGTETVLVLYPLLKDERSKILKRLQLFKKD